MGVTFNPFTGTFDFIVTRIANAFQSGLLSPSDWIVFNNKLDASRFNYISDFDAESPLAPTLWNLYDDTGRTDPAYYVDQDITWTAVAAGNAGNGINIQYIFHATQPSSTPLVTVVNPTLITVAWYNGPTISNNPTATQLKAAFDAVPGAVALATCTISGTAGDLQYINGSHVLANGGDTAPVDGAGGTPSDLTFTRSTVDPIVGVASFLLSKGASDQMGCGVSIDFTTNNADGGNPLQISFYYSASAGAVLGNSSDSRIFLYDITNNDFIPVTLRNTLTGPTADTIYRFSGQFDASTTSVNYRLIIHTATANAAAWDLKLDSIFVSPILDDAAATEVPKIVIPAQPITAAVNNNNGPMAVMWQDGNTSWRPATMASGADSTTLWGFATNIVGLTADIVRYGYLDGFSIGPFLGFNQYVDTVAGGISPLPSPFTDTGVVMGKGVAEDAILVNPVPFTRLVTSKGGLLTNAGANNGTGDQVLVIGTNGSVPVAASAQTLGIQWAAAIVNGNGFAYTVATRTLVLTLAGDVTGVATATAIAATTVTGKLITGYVSGAGTVAATDTILQAINKLNGNNLLKANIASPTFTGVPAAPTAAANTNTTQLATTAFVTTADNLKANLASPTFTGVPAAPTAAANTNTTQIATTAFVTTADNLKANLAAPTFTGDVNSSTGNVLISTIGKGLQVKTGTNAKIGTAVLVGGTVTVNNTSVTANSRIFLSVSATGGTPSTLSYTKIASTSFTINSANVLDTSTIDWFIMESIP